MLTGASAREIEGPPLAIFLTPSFIDDLPSDSEGISMVLLIQLAKVLSDFCHSARRTKILKLDSCLMEGI